MKYINQLTDNELHNFFYNYFSHKLFYIVKAIRFVRKENSLEVSVWYNKNEKEKYIYSDFSPINKWVKFMYFNFGEEYLKDYFNSRKKIIKSMYKEEKLNTIMNHKVTDSNLAKKRKRNKIKNS